MIEKLMKCENQINLLIQCLRILIHIKFKSERFFIFVCSNCFWLIADKHLFIVSELFVEFLFSKLD